MRDLNEYSMLVLGGLMVLMMIWRPQAAADEASAPEAETGKTRRAGMSQPLLAVEGLMMRFGGLLAVNNVALELHPQEIVSLIGPNGAGKPRYSTA